MFSNFESDAKKMVAMATIENETIATGEREI